jgi:hypothetical protein
MLCFMQVLVLLFTSLMMGHVFADIASAPTHPMLPQGYLLCPKISSLHKDPKKLIWFAQGGWQSFSPSFATQIGHFLGAQWQGVNVGNISCVYRGKQQMSFPIILMYNNLVYMPQHGKWTKNLGGYTNCKSMNRSDCPFKPRTRVKSGNIYQQARQLKESAQPEMGF